MCYEVKCSSCEKTSWGGCGRHVASVYDRIPQGQHCQCKNWPGVKTTGDGNGNGNGNGDVSGNGDGEAGKTASSCSIL